LCQSIVSERIKEEMSQYQSRATSFNDRIDIEVDAECDEYGYMDGDAYL